MPEELFWSTLVAAFAWMATKRWEITERRRLRYIEVASRIPSLMEATGSVDGRQELIREIYKLWIDGSPAVVRAAEKALNAIQNSSDKKEDEWKDLILLMRRDARSFWQWRDISADEITFRAAS
jgi:hypothetical protein